MSALSTICHTVFSTFISVYVGGLHRFGQVVLADLAMAWFDLLFNNGSLSLVS